MVLDYRQLSKLKSTYVDALPALINPARGRLHTTFNQTGTATGRLSSANPNLQNIPIRTELGREIRAAFIAEPGNVLLDGRLFADRAAAAGALLGRSAAGRGLPARRRHSYADRVAGLRRAAADGHADHRRHAKAVNFGIVYGLSRLDFRNNLASNHARPSSSSTPTSKSTAECAHSSTGRWKRRGAT